ncbi:hypothetical protein EOD40_03595 [Flavobacterium sufflavum]|uniref:Uncharacterized protein n=1 Tax=Flavobacterium sufflavum TaxID=1921138 RepID=A0A3S2U518_9FLAO|nr:hypothetical protein [Flavobacterium sufflavum]RVT78332.1 hypothetical protein EOD40_03595 [Flavobacterium sufflavum]
MKKRLEADLISIAHRILQLKDKSDINQLYLETQKLYEKLSVLKFIEENYADAKPTIGNYSEIEKEIENIYDKEASQTVETEITEINLTPETEIVETSEEAQETVFPETEIENPDDEIPSEEIISIEEAEMENNDTEFHEQEPEFEIEEEEEIEEETEEKTADEAVEIPEFKAAFELDKETETEIEEVEEAKKPEAVQISFEDLLGLSYNEPEFVKVDEVAAPPAKDIVFEKIEEVEKEIEETETPLQKEIETTEKSSPKTVSLNEKFSKGIDIDLNDRIAFVKHLFGNSNEDYNRVMNQLITYDNFYETKSFIDEMVKPDYNNWEGKEEYEERFMEIIEKKFL